MLEALQYRNIKLNEMRNVERFGTVRGSKSLYILVAKDYVQKNKAKEIWPGGK